MEEDKSVFEVIDVAAFFVNEHQCTIIGKLSMSCKINSTYFSQEMSLMSTDVTITS